MREGGRELSGYRGGSLILGILWTLFGTYVLSYRVGSLAAVAALVGVAFLFGGITQLVVASRVQSWRWLYILSGILRVAAGIVPSSGRTSHLYVVSHPGGLVPDRLRHHPPGRRAGRPQGGWWWTGLLLGVAELALGVWAVRSWERSLLTLMTLVGVWAIVYGVNRSSPPSPCTQAGKQAERLAG